MGPDDISKFHQILEVFYSWFVEKVILQYVILRFHYKYANIGLSLLTVPVLSYVVIYREGWEKLTETVMFPNLFDV